MFKNYQSAIKQFNELLLSNSIDPTDDFDSFGEQPMYIEQYWKYIQENPKRINHKVYTTKKERKLRS